MTVPHDLLLCSVVIPTYNRPDKLAICLDALARQTLPTERWEVIVVDDGSRESMEPIVEMACSDLQITLIRQDNAGPARARNTGATRARATYLAFTDDDCQPLPDWLEQIVSAFEQHPSALIGGHTLNALPNNLYSTASQLLIDYLYEHYSTDNQRETFFASNNFAVPRAAYLELEGFDTSFPLAAGEDREFCDRWQHAGFPVYYAPAARIYHAHKLTLASFWRQHFNYGRGAFHYRRVRSQRQREPIEVEALSFYLKLLTYPISQQQGIVSLVLSSLFFLSQVANVAGFFTERRQATTAPTFS